jgi:hypothetical protein
VYVVDALTLTLVARVACAAAATVIFWPLPAPLTGVSPLILTSVSLVLVTIPPERLEKPGVHGVEMEK